MNRKAGWIASLGALAALLFVTCSKDDSPVAPKETNEAPVFTSTSLDTAFGQNFVSQQYTATLAATDADGDSLTYSIKSGPAGLSVVAGTGVITWTPSTATDATVTAEVSDGQGGTASLTWTINFLSFVKNTSLSPVLNVNDPYFLYRTPYVDTLWLTDTTVTFTFLQRPDTTMMVTPNDSLSAAIITWTYPDSHASAQQLDTAGTFSVSIVVTSGSASDTVAWTFHVNTQPYPLTTQYQMPYANYLGNTYLDTMTVVDDEGDLLTFSISDPGTLGVTNKGIVRRGDTTLYIVEFTANTEGSYPVTITMTDIFGMDTTMGWTAKVSPKVMLLSAPEFMKGAVGIGTMYMDTIEIFSEYAGTVAFNLLQGPTGLTVGASSGIVSWSPTAADSALTSVELVRGANLEKDTLTWTVKAVTISNYVFWQAATDSGYNLQQVAPGPGLPSAVQVLQGMIATWNTRLGTADNDGGFAIGNGLNFDGTNPASGRSSMIWSNDLCDMTGTAVRAVVRGELRDGWSGNSFVHSGRITMKVGVVDLIVYRDLPAANGGWGGTIPCDAVWKGVTLFNPWSYDMKFYQKPGPAAGGGDTIPGLMAEQIVTIQAPAGRPKETDFSINDGKFFEIDVTPQVQWILDRKAMDYVQTTRRGDYAIAFLVANDATLGGEGKVNMYSDECGAFTQTGVGSDTPWTQDGNTMHILVEGNLVVVP